MAVSTPVVSRSKKTMGRLRFSFHAPVFLLEQSADQVERLGGVAAEGVGGVLHLVRDGVAQHLFERVEYAVQDLFGVAGAAGYFA